MDSHRSDIAASGFGALLFTALYAAIASQQFTRYAYPAGMDLTIAGVVPREAVGILVDSLWPLIVAVNAILLGFHAAAGGLLGFVAGRFWDAAYRLHHGVDAARAALGGKPGPATIVGCASSVKNRLIFNEGYVTGELGQVGTQFDGTSTGSSG
jgi:hypothetical protein